MQVVEDAENVNLVGRRVFHARDDPFDSLSEKQFIRTYRARKNMVRDLVTIVEPFIAIPSRNSALDVTTKVLIALNFFAYGGYQFNFGQNVNSAVSQSSVSRAIEEVVNALNMPQIMNDYIHFPRNMDELQRIRNRHRFPGCVGCLDCTHIAIYPPPSNDPNYPEHIYVNRKGYHSINTQLICDSHLRIMNVSARFPGSTHDCYIWNNSNVKPFMELLHRRGHKSFLLLGDSGYALRSYVLTPYNAAARNTPEWRYNERHRSTRSTIERCNGVLKLRFRCLLKHRVLHYTPPKASRIINACCVLHNMCIDANLPHVDPEPEDEDVDFGMFDQGNPNPEMGGNDPLQLGRHQRNMIARTHFA